MPEKTSPLHGILLALLSFALYATHDIVVKMLGGSYAVFQIVFFSTLFTFPLVVFMLLRDGEPGTLLPRHPWWTAVRTAAAVTTGFCAFYAFSVLPLAQVYAMIFACPLLITVLAIPILGEKVGLHRGGACLVGLVGVMVVLRPGGDGMDLKLGHAAGLLAAFSGALAAVVVRKIGREERAAVLMLYPMVANFAVMGMFLPFVYKPMPLGDLGLWVAMAGLAFLAGLTVIYAYRRADAVLVAPMQYSQIIWAAVYGWLFFGEVIDLGTAIGAGIIIVSGLYIVFREGRGESRNVPVLRTRTRVETGTSFRIGRLLSPEARRVRRPAR